MRFFLSLLIGIVSSYLYALPAPIDITDNLSLENPQEAHYFSSINTFIVIDGKKIFIKNNLYSPWMQFRSDELLNQDIVDIRFNTRSQTIIFYTNVQQFIFDRDFNLIEEKQEPFNPSTREKEHEAYTLSIKDNKIIFSSNYIPNQRFKDKKFEKPIMMIDELLKSLRYYPYIPEVNIAAAYQYSSTKKIDGVKNDTFYSGSIYALWNLDGEEINHKRELLSLKNKYHELLSAYYK